VEGTNKLVKTQELENEVAAILAGKGKIGKVPELWDGKAAERIVDILMKKSEVKRLRG